MAKTLNQFLEGYLKVKNPDEQKFVDKHVTAKHSDRNGNDDEVFKGSKVKPIDRRKERHGYNPGEDEKVYEEAEVQPRRVKLTKGWGDGGKSMKGGYGKLAGDQHKIDANKNGKVDAHDFKLLRKKKVAEEAEQIDELSKGAVEKYANKAFDQSNSILKSRNLDLPKSVKKSAEDAKERRRKGIVSAGKRLGSDEMKKISKSSADRIVYNKEEVEELDEISAGLASRYLNRAQSTRANDKAQSQLPMKKRDNRMAGSNLAREKIRAGQNKDSMARVGTNEEVKLEEKLNMDKASMGTVIKDFQKSDAPQFKGKSPEKRRAMAIAAKLTAERGGKALRKEEKLADLIDGLSESHQRTMLSVFDKLNEDNQKKFLQACETPEGVEQMLDFSISHRGE